MSLSDNMRSDFEHVPIVEVTTDNIQDVGPAIRVAIGSADLIAIDCELSGLGDRKKLNVASMDDRYNYISLAAKTRSIISLGLSTFRKVSSESKCVHFQVQTYNLLVLCSEDYIVEPTSLKFLVEHGFDFSKQYSKGLPYYRGNDKAEISPLRDIFSELVAQKKPIVFHNGFIDLVYLYQNFYAQLPMTLDSFVADLTEMFPLGIYDTKYLADFVCRTPSSFLEFVFKTLQKRNVKRGQTDHLHIKLSFPNYPQDCPYLDMRKCSYTKAKDINGALDVTVCDNFANHGHCSNGKNCDKSHNIDRIVLHKGGLKRKMTDDDTPTDYGVQKSGQESNPESQISGGHRAGFDAFMTGFSFLVFLTHKNESVTTEKMGLSKFLDSNPVHPDLDDNLIANKVYLGCKDIPLLIKKSSFAKNTIEHAQKIQKIRV